MLRLSITLPEQDREAQLIDRQIQKLQKELERNSNYKRMSFEKFSDGIIDEKMYREYSEIYARKCEDISLAIEKHQTELDKLLHGNSSDNEWIRYIKQYRKIASVDRVLLIMLIDRIEVYENNRFKVVFKYQDQFNLAKEYIKERMEDKDGKNEPS